MTQIEPKTADLVAHYAVLTKETMPELARTTHRHLARQKRSLFSAYCAGYRVWWRLVRSFGAPSLQALNPGTSAASRKSMQRYH